MLLYMTFPEKWEALCEDGDFKRFKILSLKGVGQKDHINKDLKKIIKGEGLGNLTLLVDFEILFNGKEYVLETEIQNYNGDRKFLVKTDVKAIKQTPVATEFVDDVFRRFDLEKADFTNDILKRYNSMYNLRKPDFTVEELKAIFFTESPFRKESPFYAEEAYEYLEEVINIIIRLTDGVNGFIFNKVQEHVLQEYIKRHTFDYYGIDLEAIERDKASDLQSIRKIEFSSPSF